jgi:hypothetical protein
MMARRKLKWRITAVTMACCLGLAALGRAQFTSLSDRSRSMLEGNWQSCREADGQYGERVYDGRWPGMSPFELHMGPHHEFAFFRGIQDGHRDHNSHENLLRPFNIEPRGQSARHSWDVAGLRLQVVHGRRITRRVRELVRDTAEARDGVPLGLMPFGNSDVRHVRPL